MIFCEALAFMTQMKQKVACAILQLSVLSLPLYFLFPIRLYNPFPNFLPLFTTFISSLYFPPFWSLISFTRAVFPSLPPLSVPSPPTSCPTFFIVFFFLFSFIAFFFLACSPLSSLPYFLPSFTSCTPSTFHFFLSTLHPSHVLHSLTLPGLHSSSLALFASPLSLPFHFSPTLALISLLHSLLSFHSLLPSPVCDVVSSSRLSSRVSPLLHLFRP